MTSRGVVRLAIAVVVPLAASAIAFRVYGERAAREYSPRVSIIDFYGLQTVTAQQIRPQLGFREGESGPFRLEPDWRHDLLKLGLVITRSKLAGLEAGVVEARLKRIPGVDNARITLVTGSDGTTAFVGIAERNAPHSDYRPAPSGTLTLPKSMIDADQENIDALMTALTNGKSPDEDDSQGHALSSDPAMRAAEQKATQFAASNLAVVRDVLKNSSDAGQRATAAWVIGYAPDKRLILGDLLDAVRDPDENVRNNSTRALGVIAEFASEKPELGIHIDPTRFVDMLNSLMWVDRNKATMVLNGIGDSPDAVSQMRQRALPSLVEMARWKDSHSLDALLLLGRIAGIHDDEVQKAWDKGDRERIIALATSGTQK
jgi:hypothetical protein